MRLRKGIILHCHRTYVDPSHEPQDIGLCTCNVYFIYTYISVHIIYIYTYIYIIYIKYKYIYIYEFMYVLLCVYVVCGMCFAQSLYIITLFFSFQSSFSKTCKKNLYLPHLSVQQQIIITYNILVVLKLIGSYFVCSVAI